MSEQWEPGQAIVIESTDIGGSRHSYLLEAVAADDHESFRAQDEDPPDALDTFVAPRPSELVDALIDWNHKRIRLVRDAPGRVRPESPPAPIAEELAPPHHAPSIVIGPNVHIVMDPRVKLVINPDAKITIDPSVVIEKRALTEDESSDPS